MKNPNTRRVLLALTLGSAVTFTACQSEKNDKPETTEESAATWQRHIELEGQSNFRDLGGYQTADGKTVKRGLVFRTGELPKLTDPDVEKLAEIQLKTVVNFLTENEIARSGPDRLPPGTRQAPLPIDHDPGDGSLIDELIAARKTGDFSKIPADFNPEIHRLLTEEAKQQYAALFRTILDSDSLPLAFHCSHGVHRTGTASAILLGALGVPWETIREDYLLSNTCRADEVGKRLAQLHSLAAKTQNIPAGEVDTTNMEAFYVLQPEYIDATLDEIKKQYGTLDGYLREGLGLSDDELTRLRDLLLE